MSFPRGEEYLEQFVIRSSQWLCFLTLNYVAPRLLGSGVRIPLRKWICRLLGLLCFAQVLQRTDHSFRGVLLGVGLNVCDLETSVMRLPTPDLGCSAIENYSTFYRVLCVLVTRIETVYFK